MKVGVVMPTINLWNKYTKPAIASVVKAMEVAEGKGISTKFLLIDNASTDETPKEATIELIESKVPFHYHRNEEMWGFQKSVNFGVNYFFNDGFDYFLVLNNDIVLHENAIVRLFERFSKGDVGMATCLDATGECERNPENLAKMDDKEKESCPETENPCFSAFMINKNCWIRIGEFDEIFAPAYYEDNDYHYRMRLDGLPAITYPPALFFHWGSATQLEALGRPLTNSANQHHEYIRKWGGDPGKERFRYPYQNFEKNITSVKQK